MIPKSASVVWIPLSSIMKMKYSTLVALISIVFNTLYPEQSTSIVPLNIPASLGVYVIVISFDFFGGILK